MSTQAQIGYDDTPLHYWRASRGRCTTAADGATAAIYGQYPPLVNACRPPGAWQTYDIIWIAPRFDGQQLISAPTCTVIHNGIAVQYHRVLLGPTTHREVPRWTAHLSLGPLRLQDHGDPVRFRNIWYRALEQQEAAA